MLVYFGVGARSAPLQGYFGLVAGGSKTKAFPSGEGGPRAVDEENTASTYNRLSHLTQLSINSYFFSKPDFHKKAYSIN